MSLRTGRLLRRGGLIVEAACLIGLATISRQPLQGRRESLFDPASLLAIGLGVGFFAWALGTGIIYRSRVLSKQRVHRLDL